MLKVCRVFKVGTPFDRVWRNQFFLNGSLQSKPTFPETKKCKESLSPFFSGSAIRRVVPIPDLKKLSIFLKVVRNQVDQSSKVGIKKEEEEEEEGKGHLWIFSLLIRSYITASRLIWIP